MNSLELKTETAYNKRTKQQQQERQPPSFQSVIPATRGTAVCSPVTIDGGSGSSFGGDKHERRLLSTATVTDLRWRQWRLDATELGEQAASSFSPASFLPHTSILPCDSNDITAVAV
ncbi:hypothetical protein AAHE18_06G209300 [Arachis hypogaea]